ncbi:MAG: CehA/McbA family metallohydrolase [Myxococcales bacterium]|nr:CehA/McbA family metallohydrolase [Myxococcales bacterium]
MDAPRALRIVALLFGAASLMWACSQDDADPKPDATADAAALDAAGEVGAADGGLVLPPGKHVGADLSDHLPNTTATGAYVRPFESGDGFKGSAAQAKKGDWIIGNPLVRYAIQGDDRHIGVCPWGGTLLDGSAKRADGSWSDDEMGEHCILFNLGRTLKPDHFEVLADGKAGGPVVFAVTGTDTLLDFINLPSMLANFPLFGDDLEIPMDPDADLDVTITRYYILAPDDAALRIVTAYRNDGDKEFVIGTGELIDSGGEVEFFNPASSSNGFGSGGGFGAQKLDYLAFRSPRGSHAYAPPLAKGGPGAGYLAVGGAGGVLMGTDSVLPLLLGGKTKFEASVAALHVKPGQTVTRHHLAVAGTGDLNSISAPIWRGRGMKLAAVTGTAVDAKGKPIQGARVSLLYKSAAQTQTVSGADGGFSVDAPAGARDGGWQLQAWHPAFGVSDLVDLSSKAPKLTFGETGKLRIFVVDGAGKKRPAKVTIYCPGECERAPTTLYDSGADRPGDDAYDAHFIGVDGEIAIDLPTGKYKVIVSGGPTHSLWPTDAHTTGGHALEVTSGSNTKLDAKLYKAVDTTGWLSGDFHVHAVNSPDSPVENRRRVRSFLAEGVDVLVQTDHDFISDLSPEVKAEKAESRLVFMSGVEVTPFDYGHFNAFPLKHDPNDLAGGAPDWGGGAGKGLDPPTIRAQLSKMGPGFTPVVQLNHPTSYLRAVKADVLGGISLAPRAPFRVSDKATDDKTGDTGMFTDKFDAMELLTGHRSTGAPSSSGFGGDNFGQIVNWWFTLLSRGVRWTGTAVSDAHSALRSQAGGARTYVYVGDKTDTPQTFDMKGFTQAMHDGKAMGSDGLFMRMWITEGDKKAALGETIALPLGTMATVTVEVQAAYWADIDRVELYHTPTQTFALAGEFVDDLPKPFAVHSFEKSAQKLTAGFDKQTQRYVLTAKFELTGTGKDGYIVALAHGKKPLPSPIVGGRKVLPLAFVNPIFIDGDGSGYDHPPLSKKVQPKPPPPPKRTGPPTSKQWRSLLRELEHR